MLIFKLFHVCSKVIFLFTEDQSRTQMLHKYRSANVHLKIRFFDQHILNLIFGAEIFLLIRALCCQVVFDDQRSLGVNTKCEKCL